MEPVYLDYNATTPVDPLVIEAIRPYLERHFGNPSSAHAYGVQSKIAVEQARTQVASLLNARSDEIVFTSGGTESNNFAIKGVAFANRAKGNHIITSAIEHPAVTEVCRFLEKCGFKITYLPVDAYGMVDPGEVELAITSKTILITIMHANNETGTIQPIGEIGKIARAHGILFHTDAAQSVGKIPVDVEEMNISLLSVAGHKLYAPKGVGALYVRRGVKLEKLIHGADHESNLRAGTENVMEIVGLGKAAELLTNDELRMTNEDPVPAVPGRSGEIRNPNSELRNLKSEIRNLKSEIRNPESEIRNPNRSEAELGGAKSEIRNLRDMLYEGIRAVFPEVRLNGHPELRLPNTLSLGFPGVEAALLLEGMKGVAASAGAACHTDQADISGVLSAMHVPMEYAIGTIRFSLGRITTREEIEKAIPIIVDAYRRLKGEGEPRMTNDELRMTNDELRMTNYELRLEDSGLLIGDQGIEEPNRKSQIVNPKSDYRLTEYTHALGCACKIRPQLLEKILQGIPRRNNPAILVGHETSDDAAVYRIDGNTAIVQTVDFIPPVVDDPYMYGAISAANALSDVYAMGGKPLFALSIVGFPDRKLPIEVLQQILKGANDKVAEAGIQVIGGHSIEDSEPKFGLVVTGIVHPAKIIRNSTARPGDVLILTKPIGTGIITTAIKRGLADEADVRRVMQVMAELNKVPAEIMADFPVNACTDVTGFGLLGHLKEMVCGAGVQAVLWSDQVPIMDAAWKHAAAGTIPGGTKNNLDYVSAVVQWKDTTPELMKFILADAQTSGGLLISLPESQAAELVARLKEAGVGEAAIIGKIVAGELKISV